MRLLKWFGLGTGSWVVWRLFGPEPSPRFPPPQTNPLPVPGRTVIVGEYEFFVRESGSVEAPAVVLIHGWNLDGAMTFHHIIPALSRRYRVIVPDLRNHGRSDWVRGPVEIAELADDVAGILDALGLGGSTVLGFSMGGLVVQELARRHPRHVGRMILAATAARPISQTRLLARVAFWLARGGLHHASTPRPTARLSGRAQTGPFGPVDSRRVS